MSRFRNCLVFLLRGLIFLSAVLAVLLVGALIALRQNPQALAQRIAGELHTRTGLACSMGLVDVVALPVPALALSDVRLSGAAGELTVAYATVRPSLLSLLRGVLAPGEITLLRPECRLRLSSLWGDSGGRIALPALPDVLRGCRISLLHGMVDVTTGDGVTVLAEDLRCALTPQSASRLQGWLSLADLRVYRQKTLAGALEALHVRVDGALLDPAFVDTASIHVKTRVQTASLLRRGDLDVRLSRNARAEAPSIQDMRLSLDGDLDLGGQAIPFRLQGTAEDDPEDAMSITVSRLDLGEDHCRLSAVLTPAGLEGTAEVRRLSLSRWFGFGRALPAGLQHALDRVSGTLDFSADKQGLTVSRLQATAGGALFEGKGGVERWGAPVLRLDLAAATADLGSVLPEAVGRNIVPPSFGHPPLLPLPMESAAPDLGYDIVLRADAMRWAGLELKKAVVGCTPYKDTVRLTAEIGNVYGGTAQGRLLLGGNADSYDIHLDVKKVQMERLAARVPGMAKIGGRGSATADCTARGDTMAAFLRSLHGAVLLRLEDGFFRQASAQNAKNQKFTVNLLELHGQLRAQTTPSRLAGAVFDGVWRGTLRAPGLTVAAHGRGPVHVPGLGASPRLHKLPGDVRLEVAPSLCGLEGGIQADITGEFSLDADRCLRVERARATFLGMALQGDADGRLTASGAELQGRLTLKTQDLRGVLARCNLTPPPSVPRDMLRTAEIAAAVTASPGSLALKDIRGRVDGTGVRGQLSGTWRERPAWHIDLTADALDLDRYRTPTPREGSLGKSSAPWDGATLRAMDVRGMVRCRQLRLHKLVLHNVQAPIAWQKGVLECAPLQADIYGGRLAASLRCAAARGVQVNAHWDVTNLTLQRLTEDLALKTIMTGRGAGGARIQGLLRAAADIPGVFDGVWRYDIVDGFLQSRDARGHVTGSRTRFSLSRASGTVRKGVLHTSDVLLQGPDLRVAGGGWVNLRDQTLDVTLNVGISRIPEFPLRFYGSLAAPQSTVQPGRAIVGALGSLGAGVMDAVGNVVGGALRLLLP